MYIHIYSEGREVSDHILFTCEIMKSFSHESYWDGKVFKAKEMHLPKYLLFYGSGQFASIS